MKKIFLIRHGETDHNYENRMSGWTEALLSQQGKRQAIMLGERLAGVSMNRIITSGMERAVETALLAFPQWRENPGFETIVDLKEMNFGRMEGMTLNEIQSQYPEDFVRMMEKKGRFTFPEGENLHSFHRRIQRGGHQVREMTGETIAVVAHSGTIRSLLAGWIARDWRAHWRFLVDHCSLTRICFHDGFPVLTYCNDTTHLGPAE